jgi:hypothetical protein
VLGLLWSSYYNRNPGIPPGLILSLDDPQELRKMMALGK